MSRWWRSLGALMVLGTALVGVPAALVRLGGPLLPADLRWSSVLRALTIPDDGSIVLGLITLVGWLGWAVFTLSVLTELVAVLSRSRIRIRLPGLGGPQRVAAGLIFAVLALSAAPAVPAVVPLTVAAQAAPVEAGRPSPVAVPGQPAARHEAVATSTSSTADPGPTRTHVVTAGDDLWSLAERYYDDGREWRAIARANPNLLTGGPDRLTVGWRLAIPGGQPDAEATGSRTVTVRRGETLSDLADRELGSPARWPEIFHANRAQLDDPDELEVGMQLVLPAAAARAADPTSSAPPARANPLPTRPDRAPADSSAKVPAEASGPSRPPTPSPAATPEPSASSAATSEPAPARSTEVETAVDDRTTIADAALPLAAVGGLLAAGLVAGLVRRRQLQLQLRPVGRRIVHPPPATRPVELALGRRQRPLSLRTLDQALRAVGAHCRAAGSSLPALDVVLVGEDQIELVLAEVAGPAPLPFRVEGRSWVLDAADADYLRSVPGADEALRPWPALVTLGRDERNRQVLVDLEAFGLLGLEGGDDVTGGVLAALAVELSFSPWAEELALTLVGVVDRLPDALGTHTVRHEPDVEGLLARLQRRAAEQRRHQPYPVLGQHRLDPDLADPWAPEIVLVGVELTPDQQQRLHAVVGAEPRVPVAAVVAGSGTAGSGTAASWSLRWDAAGAAVLEPVGLALVPSRLAAQEQQAVLQLVEETGRTDTTPAPWWAGEVVEPEPPPDNVTYLGRRFGGWATDGEEGGEVATATAGPVGVAGTADHPTLLLLGPVELLGARGVLPARAGRQCLEYCAWLLEHPGRSAQSMAAALAVAEGTRRSNMSRLRSWLGESEDAQAYLPDAYTGRIALHPAVSSDWQRLQILTATGVNRSSPEALRAALQLVRGAPLADAAPGQWFWAEELRTDMISCVRDVGVELTRRALEDGDLDLARWAAARALVAAPGDEQLLAARIRTEHRAGNPAETERLTLQLAAQARRLGVDLDEQTVVLLQQVMEGRVRARMA